MFSTTSASVPDVLLMEPNSRLSVEVNVTRPLPPLTSISGPLAAAADSSVVLEMAVKPFVFARTIADVPAPVIFTSLMIVFSAPLLKIPRTVGLVIVKPEN